MKKTMAALFVWLLVCALCVGAHASIEAGEYNRSLLINWTDAALREAYGVGAKDFVPSNPQPLTYIVRCESVIDPLTGRESEGGWSYSYRIYPASAEDVLWEVSDLSDFGLTLTDDPNQATYRADITYKYYRDGSFNYQSEHARIPMYAATLTVKLVNMVTGESAQASRECWCFTENYIEKSVLDAGIGEQFYAGPDSLSSTEISAFSDLLGLGYDALYDYEDDEGGGICITNYLGDDVNTLVLPATIQGKPVTGIGEGALSGNGFHTVVLPDTVTHIEQEAFQGCYDLATIAFPPSLTRIGPRAFDNCGLREINLPDSLTDLGDHAFAGCDEAKSLRLPAGITVIPESAFWYCGFTKLEIPDTVTEIGESAFGSCDKLKSIYVPANVHIIGESAFGRCDSLTEITFAGEIELLGHAALEGNENLTSVTFAQGVRVVGEYAFASCPKLKTVDLYGAKSLGESAFRWDTGLKSVILPETLTEIAPSAFGDHTAADVTYAVPKGLTLSVIEGSYAEEWAIQWKVPYVSVAPPTEEELMARQYPPMKTGSKGENVRRLQQALIDQGFLDDTADGSYGPKTAAAVSAAQEVFGMEADGVASALFQARLYGEP